MENSFLLLRQFPEMRHLVLTQIIFLLFEYLLRISQLQIQEFRCSNSMLLPALEIPFDKVRSQLICHLGNDRRILPLICNRENSQAASRLLNFDRDVASHLLNDRLTWGRSAKLRVEVPLINDLLQTSPTQHLLADGLQPIQGAYAHEFRNELFRYPLRVHLDRRRSLVFVRQKRDRDERAECQSQGHQIDPPLVAAD